MDNMATMSEKIVDMLSTIREIREKIRETGIIGPFQVADSIERMFDEHPEIGQRELFKKFPKISPRTMRRHLQQLLDQDILIARKRGREVSYAKREHLSTKSRID